MILFSQNVNDCQLFWSLRELRLNAWFLWPVLCRRSTFGLSLESWKRRTHFPFSFAIIVLNVSICDLFMKDSFVWDYGVRSWYFFVLNFLVMFLIHLDYDIMIVRVTYDIQNFGPIFLWDEYHWFWSNWSIVFIKRKWQGRTWFGFFIV